MSDNVNDYINDCGKPYTLNPSAGAGAAQHDHMSGYVNDCIKSNLDTLVQVQVQVQVQPSMTI